MNHPTTITDPTTLLLLGVGAVALLMLLIIRLKVHAFVALIVVSLATALFAGIAPKDVMPVLMQGFSGTLAAVALLVGLGTMIGKILEQTGGAKVLADTLIHRFGEKRAPLALGMASLLFGFPIFFDAGLIVLMPILLTVANRVNGSVLHFALPVAGAFAVMHAFVPPHPGPVAAGDLLGADLGLLLAVGLVIALVSWYFGAYLYAIYAGERFRVPLPAWFTHESNVNQHHTTPPTFATVIGILLVPVVLIFLNTGIHSLQVAGYLTADNLFTDTLKMVGQTPVALLVTLLLCLALFTRQFGRKQMETLCTDSLAPICAIILVTGAGGMFGGVLRASGIGEALAGLLSASGMPVIVAAFVISTCLRVAQGSATVALTTTAALMAPVVAATTGLSSLDLCFIVIAIAGGATVLSHFNDSGFWLVSRLLGMDEKTTLKTWTVMETLLGSIAFLLAAALSVVF